MSKYARLGDFLRDQREPELRLRFGEIERIIGNKLPPAARSNRAFWSNNPSNNVMTKVWLDAGFETAQVDLSAAELTFRRKQGRSLAARPSELLPTRPANANVKAHPLRGLLKHVTQVPPGVDLTQPADAEWASAVDRRYGG